MEQVTSSSSRSSSGSYLSLVSYIVGCSLNIMWVNRRTELPGDGSCWPTPPQMYKLAAYTGVPLVHRSTLPALLQLAATISTKDLICQACEKDKNKTKEAWRRYSPVIYSEFQLVMISSASPRAQCVRMNTIIRGAPGALMIYLKRKKLNNLQLRMTRR